MGNTEHEQSVVSCREGGDWWQVRSYVAVEFQIL